MSLKERASLLSLFPEGAEVRHNRLFIAGWDTVELADKFGTPLYVFDELTLRRRCAEFKDEFSRRYPQSQVIYASKAFICQALARLLQEEGLGLDVVSGGEMAIARRAGFPMDAVYFHGNNKSPQELRQALDWGVGRIVVDNFYELSLLEGVAAEMGKAQEILLRLSPGVDPHTHRLTSTGIVDSKFGFLMSRAEEAIVQALGSPHLRLIGLHFHLGSPLFETQPYQEAIALVLAFAAEMVKKHCLELREFSPGGGFAVSYVRETPAPPIAYYAEAIVSTLRSQLDKYGLGSPRLFIEPGRAIVGRAGVALYRVGSAKDIPGVRRYVSVDGGMGDNIRPALYGARYEALAASRAEASPTEKVTLAGKFCESGDILARDIDLPSLSPGDIIAIPAMGAYSVPMASNYNASLRPAILMLRKGNVQVIRRRQTYEDLVREEEI